MTAASQRLPTEAFAAALADLDGLGAGRLRSLFGRYGPAEAWQRVCHGELPDAARLLRCVPHDAAALVTALRQQAATVDVDARWDQTTRCCTVLIHGHPGYPAELHDDPQPPAVLFARGDLSVLSRYRRVAVVGTRSATGVGRTVATDLGADLAERGIIVVSGLASGIDGAAHRGALSVSGAPPVAVVGSGPDVVYPTANAALWDDVIARGLLLSEVPVGRKGKSWRFPQRNRVLAALGELLVVVESDLKGGSMITVRAAYLRGRTVLAVPGSVRSRQSRGTNQLLFDGAGVARDSADVLGALGLEANPALNFDRRPEPDAQGAAILSLLAEEAYDLSSLAERTGQSPLAVARTVGWLEAAGWVRTTQGWFELAPVPR
jgi:DNA processing protein